MAKIKWYYLHTLSGKPACFDGQAIWWCSFYAKCPQPLAKSLRQIKREQRLSREWRLGMGYTDGELAGLEAGYVRVSVDQEEA